MSAIAEGKYPDVITPEMLPQWAQIDDEQLERDIVETDQEGDKLDRCEDAASTLANNDLDHANRLIYFARANAYRHEAARRRAFSAFLRRLQDARDKAKEVTTQ